MDDVETTQDRLDHPTQHVLSLDLPSPRVSTLDAVQPDFGLDLRHTSLTTATDLAWLLDGPLLDFLDDDSFPVDNHNHSPRDDNAVLSSIVDGSHNSTPRCYSSGPVFAAATQEPEPQAPSCGYRVCNALTENRRAELLTSLKQDMHDLDMSSPIFSLNNMKMGVHLYARDVSKQVPIFHHQVLAPITEEDKRDIQTIYGGEAPYQLSWAIITLGWSLWDFHGGQDAQMGVMIQTVLRRSIINHPAFTLDPPIWVVQTLFLILMFARYCGSKQDHAASILFHGVLIDAVRRLDRRGKNNYIPDLNKGRPCRREWFKWIHVETLKRLVVHTFILDVQHVILHGGDMCMSPFELSLQLPYSEAVWCADSVEEWAAEMKKTCAEPALFLTMLKQFWNVSSSVDRLPQACPGDSRVILYGIMSIARDMKRRDVDTFSIRPKDSLSILNAKVLKSFESWVSWWERNRAALGLEVYLWRNCSCMLRLAYTLYEIGPVELQAAAGKDVIEGKRIGVSEYAGARRKIRLWAQEQRALLAVSKAASIIHGRLSPSYIPRAHCYQCNWALYVAGLICWNFSFVSTGGVLGDSTTTENSRRQAGRNNATYAGFAHSQGYQYLQAVLNLPHTGLKNRKVMEEIGKTADLLRALIEILELDESGLITESVELLKRLVGVLR